MTTARFVPLVLWLALFLGGCGDSAMSLTEYTEHINAVEVRASEKGKAVASSAREMKEVVERVLGCEWFPENTEDIYRYPSRASTS